MRVRPLIGIARFTAIFCGLRSQGDRHDAGEMCRKRSARCLGSECPRTLPNCGMVRSVCAQFFFGKSLHCPLNDRYAELGSYSNAMLKCRSSFLSTLFLREVVYVQAPSKIGLHLS